MGVRTIYACDRCKNEQSSGNQFWTVGIKAFCHGYSSDTFLKGKTLEVCRPCLEQMGIHVSADNPNPPNPEPTVEDLIRMIMEKVNP